MQSRPCLAVTMSWVITAFLSLLLAGTGRAAVPSEHRPLSTDGLHGIRLAQQAPESAPEDQGLQEEKRQRRRRTGDELQQEMGERMLRELKLEQEKAKRREQTEKLGTPEIPPAPRLPIPSTATPR